MPHPTTSDGGNLPAGDLGAWPTLPLDIRSREKVQARLILTETRRRVVSARWSKGLAAWPPARID